MLGGPAVRQAKPTNFKWRPKVLSGLRFRGGRVTRTTT
jgi:hypothetical protein